jgi:hypothetical protein
VVDVTVALDEPTRKKLILMRRLFQRALVMAESHPNEVDRILAVVGFDLTVETVMKAAVVSLDSSRRVAEGFDGLLQQTEDLLAARGLEPLPDRANVLHIHRIRNDAQHKARYPSPSEVQDCRTYARDFLLKFTNLVWGSVFERMSTIEIIQNEQIRTILQEAEAMLSTGEHKESIRRGALALTRGFALVERLILGPTPAWESPFSEFSLGRRYDEPLRRLRLLVQLGVLGLDVREYIRYLFVLEQAEMRNTAITEDEAEFVLGFCSETVARIESYVEPVGGRERIPHRWR